MTASHNALDRQGTLPGLTPSPISVTPFGPGVPDDILSMAARRVEELTPSFRSAGLPVTLHDILRDAVVAAYQRGKTEERTEANLLIEAMDAVNQRRQERLIDLVIMQCMDTMGCDHISVDLSRSLDGKLTTRQREGERHIVDYFYAENEENDDER